MAIHLWFYGPKTFAVLNSLTQLNLVCSNFLAANNLFWISRKRNSVTSRARTPHWAKNGGRLGHKLVKLGDWTVLILAQHLELLKSVFIMILICALCWGLKSILTFLRIVLTEIIWSNFIMVFLLCCISGVKILKGYDWRSWMKNSKSWHEKNDQIWYV